MTLSTSLLTDDARPKVTTDLVDVVRQEVHDKKGLSGTAVKVGYAAATKVMPDLVQRAVTRMLPDFTSALDPFWDAYAASGESDFGSYLTARAPEASSALLAVTDAKIAASPREPLKKAYGALRGKASSHVEAALPRLGRTVQRHA